MRLAVYGGLSSVLAAGVILSAFTQRANFYSACVYLSKSSACMMILLNMGLFISVIAGKSLQAIFFGRLRAIEVEHLYERSWYAVTETCLAMTIFREEFDLQFVVVFTTLLFLKIFHWLCQDRVEFMEQTPSHGTVFHMRMVNMMLLLFLLDYSLASHAIHATWTKGPNMMIMFGFEYTIMLCSILSSICKYTLNVIDLRSQEPWEGKSMYVFFVDLLTDFLKLVTYIVFFVIICFYYQLPLHIVRDVYVTFRSFIQKCRDLYRYRRATRNMDQLYPNASLDDLSQSSDSTCIICREEMVATSSSPTSTPPPPPSSPSPSTPNTNNNNNLDQPKKLPCGHIFHFHCLRSWLERQQTCPTCRRSVLADDNNNNNTTTTPAPPPANNNHDAQQGAAAPPQQQQNYQHLFHRIQETMQPQSSRDPLSPPPPQQQQPSSSSSSFQHNNTNTNHLSPQAQPPFFGSGLDSGFNINLSSSSTSTPFGTYGPTLQPQQQQQQQQPIYIHGMVPLAPLTASTLQQHQPTTSIPTELTPDQLATLSTETRQSMEERLKVLEVVQSQIFASMQYLATALSALPPPSTTTATAATTTTSTTTTTTTVDSPSTSSTPLNHDDDDDDDDEMTPTTTTTSTRMEDIPEDQQLEKDEGPSTRKLDKGKMRSMDDDGVV